MDQELDDIINDIHRQPQIFARLAENSLLVAESLRGNYFKNTAMFIRAVKTAVMQASSGQRPDHILQVFQINDLAWSDVHGEVVSFIDGGVGKVNIASQVPLLIRVGSYTVTPGERNLSNREQFGYYPTILGDFEGGSKDRDDFIDIVRIIAELLGGLAALQRNPDLKVLMFHGPLVYIMSGYAGHTPFTEKDIDLFLKHYSTDDGMSQKLKDEFLDEAALEIYPGLTDAWNDWIEKRIFEPLSWISFLYGKLINEAKSRKNKVTIMGVVERGRLKEFSELVLLERVFKGLRRKKKNINYFNDVFSRTDLNSPKALLERLGYTDSLLLGMILEVGQRSETWEIRSKYAGLSSGKIRLPNESAELSVDWKSLKPSSRKPYSFPSVEACYVHISESTEPIRVEVFSGLGKEQASEASKRVYLYSTLLPGYGFPVGLDIVDKFAHVPNWMTNTYGKMIKYYLGVSLQQGEVSDADMRKILVDSIYMTKRDWLFRPSL